MWLSILDLPGSVINVVKDYINKLKKYLLSIVCIGILVDIFFIKDAYEFVFVALTILCILMFRLYSLSEKFTILVTVVLFTFMMFLYMFGFKNVAEKAAIWVFVFLSFYAYGQMTQLK